LTDFQGRGFRDIGAELRAEFCDVVGKERGLAAGTGDGDVAEARVEQVGVDTGIRMDEDALGGKALGTVTGDGVAVIEMTMLVGIEFDLAVVVEAGGETTFRGRLPIGAPQSINSGIASVHDLRGLKRSVFSAGGRGEIEDFSTAGQSRR